MLHFNLSEIPASWRIEKITKAEIPYRRPRSAGKNARLGLHGFGGEVPIARMEAGGVSGFGWCTLNRQEAESLVGMPIRSLFCSDGMLKKQFRGLEFPILDWLGNLLQKPIYELVAKNPGKLTGEGYPAPVYDTTIYFDELHIEDSKEAVDFICLEVQEGLNAGHKNFKVKIGRCGMWMSLEDGLQRDIDIVNAIRGLIGETGKLMVDANNGYNLNITKKFLSATKAAKVHWIEEAFHEDDMFYAELKRWMKEEGIETMIADGEGGASPRLIDWAKNGLVDVIQHDLRDYGFFNWLEMARELEDFGILYAPHNYGGFHGNYTQVHFAAATDNFAFAEMDVASAEGIDTTAYQVKDGFLIAPNAPGFGLKLDCSVLDNYSSKNGWVVSAPLA